MGYDKRQLVKIVEEICSDNNLGLNKFSDEWILQVKKSGNPDCFIFGYKFPNNNAAVSKLCDDKAALSLILEEKEIPCVPHIYFEGPRSPMVDENGIFSSLFKMFDRYGSLVCKSNSGSGGSNVFLCRTHKDLETATFDILRSTRSMAVSPKIDIQNEYRIIVENGRALLVYSKERPFVVGDGKSTIAELMQQVEPIGASDKITELDTNRIPEKSEKVTIAWKHNLGQGSYPILIQDEKEIHTLASFALRTANALGLQFASIDIIKDDKSNYKILEINSGVMMENFSKISNEHYSIAKHIYETAINDFFGVQKKEASNIYEQISDEISMEK